MSDKAKRLKSPPYPSLSLETALAKAAELRSVANGFAVALPVAARAWGYSPKSSSISSVLGALNQYGLIDEQGTGEARRIKVSPLGERIIMDKRPGSVERAEALRIAALKPRVFQELWDHFGTVDADFGAIEYELTLGRRESGLAPYSEAAARDIAVKFRESLEFGGVGTSSEYTEATAPEPLKHVEEPEQADGAERQPLAGRMPDAGSLRGEFFEERKALDEGTAILVWPKNLNSDSVDDMEYWLNGVLKQIKRRALRAAAAAESDGSLLV